MSYNDLITVITNRQVAQQTYRKTLFVNNEQSPIHTEFIMLLDEFDFINKDILMSLANVMVANKRIDGIYSDVLLEADGNKSIQTNIAYNIFLIEKFPPIGPIFFKSKFKTTKELLSSGFLFHIPQVLFYNGKTNT